ncbi:amino acid permease [Polaribacter batillariae]|uniref:Amino acid permease n=1 Tax=Polaribacter batillariae TaxID=2808900 RepID=A0ABX7SZH6_9FLAO|nr:APC family permease [Polaribacter batillariae]QTD38204.1 amino acid permease [Polaribacter batillariae]
MSTKISLKEAMSIGIGGMVGGGIFAVLGLAVSLAKGATPISFLIAGTIALLTSYSYAKLSNTFPDRGGTVKFINVAFGKTVFSGTINNLLWISYIIMLSLYASAFGSYAPNLFKIFDSNSFNFHFYASFIIFFATLINYYSIAVVSKIESISVIIKLFILLSFILIGSYGLIGNENLGQFSIDNWENSINIIAAGMVIFVAYEGFELIANAAPDIKNPAKNISKAYYYSIIFVIILYVIIAIVTIGSLPFNKIATAEDYVLAEAAKPMLGKVGFTIITIAALISTFSAINASLYGGSRVSFEIAEDDELPHAFTSIFWNQPIGLLITAVLTLIITNSLNLESISTAGSVGFLSIFAIVNFAGYRLSEKMNSKKYIHLTGFIVCIIALIVLILQQFKNNKIGVIIAIAIIVFCLVIEYSYKKIKVRSLKI